MVRLVALLKRRPGMSIADFRTYYEEVHARLGEKGLRGYATRYMRKYLNGMPDPETGEVAETEFDVITEVWFPDRQAFEAAMARMSEPELAAEIAADEENLFDRSKIRFHTSDECESSQEQLAAGT